MLRTICEVKLQLAQEALAGPLDYGERERLLAEIPELRAERIRELRAEIDWAYEHGRDPQRQLCELASIQEEIEPT